MTTLAPPAGAAADVLLPEGTRLLHIGPPKTGTSSLQGAFHRNREATLAQGVRYAGSARHSGSAILALTGRRSFGRDAGPPPKNRWTNLLRDVRGAREPRVLISSEFFSDAEEPAMRQAVEDLDRDRLHVVVTLRPLDRLIPSQWQQYVQSDLRTAFEPWLRATLENPPGPTPSFWKRHRHDRLVQSWAALVGPERMTVVVIDERDHDHILRVFERLLGLRAGTLVPDDDTVNRSMTWPEVEAVRAYNNAFKEAGLGNALFHKSMHFGAAAYMRMRPPDPSEPRIRVPAWSREPIAEIAREMVDNLRATGIRVIGDLDTLVPAGADASDGEPGASPTQPCITPAIAARMAVGMAVVSGAARGVRAPSPARGGGRPEELAQRAELARYPTYQLFGAIFGRTRRVVGRAIERGTGRGAPEVEAADPLAAQRLTEGLIDLVRRVDAGIEAETAGRLRRAPGGLEAILAELVAVEPEIGTETAGECVAPKAVAWLALGVLGESGIVYPASRARTGKLRPALWWWCEPPELARIPSRRIAVAAPARILRGIRKRLAWRRTAKAATA